MPLTLNIGLSRKIGEPNYGSRGASINVEMEVESALLAEPARFQERIRQLFRQVRESLAEELNGQGAPPANTNGATHAAPASPGDHGPGANGTRANGNGHTNGNGHAPRPATQAQMKAIFAIARDRHLDLAETLWSQFQTERLQDLTVQEASQLIDELKLSSPTNGD